MGLPCFFTLNDDDDHVEMSGYGCPFFRTYRRNSLFSFEEYCSWGGTEQMVSFHYGCG